jgi:hypothetical protein
MEQTSRDPQALPAQAECEIRALVASYAYAVLTTDTALWMSLWAPRPEPLEDPLGMDIHWARAVADRWASLGTIVLHITTHLIRPLAPDLAVGRVFCLAELERVVDGQLEFIEQTIVYEDRYARHDGSWRFSTRRHLLWYGRGCENPRAQGPADWPRAQTGRGVELLGELAPLADGPAGAAAGPAEGAR